MYFRCFAQLSEMFEKIAILSPINDEFVRLASHYKPLLLAVSDFYATVMEFCKGAYELLKQRRMYS